MARFWDADGKEIRKPLVQPSSALGVAFSPVGKKLLTGHFDGNAIVARLQEGRRVASLRVRAGLLDGIGAGVPNGDECARDRRVMRIERSSADGRPELLGRQRQQAGEKNRFEAQ